MDKKQAQQTVVKTSSRAFPVFALLGAVLTVLKAVNATSLPWWAVLLPFYAFPALVVAFILILLVFAGVIFGTCGVIDAVSSYRRRRRIAKAAPAFTIRSTRG